MDNKILKMLNEEEAKENLKASTKNTDLADSIATMFVEKYGYKNIPPINFMWNDTNDAYHIDDEDFEIGR